jgi:hypothetical protein
MIWGKKGADDLSRPRFGQSPGFHILSKILYCNETAA